MAHSVEPVGDYVSTWGEGPIWWEDRLFYVDIESHRILRFDPSTGEEMVWNVDQRVGTVVPRTQGGLLFAGDHGFHFLDPETGETTAIADPEPDKADNRFNDGKCDPAGRLWAGTISLVKNTGDASLYCLDTSLSVTKKVESVTNSNGIIWNAARDTMYYIDTPTKKVRAYDYDLSSGVISNERVVIDTEEQGFDTSPDGMTMDEDGNLWIAFCHGGTVACFDPSDAYMVDQVDFPCIETTACAFGGPELKHLYVTTGIKKGLDEPLAGRLFVCEPGVKGVKAGAFGG